MAPRCRSICFSTEDRQRRSDRRQQFDAPPAEAQEGVPTGRAQDLYDLGLLLVVADRDVDHVVSVVQRAFMDLEIPEDLCDGYGYPQITRQDRENILGRTFATLMGVDVEAAKQKLAAA